MKAPNQVARVLPALALMCVTLLAGCAGVDQLAAESESPFCYRSMPHRPDKARYRTCTTGAIPDPQVEADAKRFEAVADAATVYVVRRSAGDSSHRIPITVDGQAVADTIPRSFVRLRLPAGEHHLAIEWNGTRHTQTLQVRAGDLRFVTLDVTAWVLGAQYGWVLPDPGYGRDKAMGSRLVADLTLKP